MAFQNCHLKDKVYSEAPQLIKIKRTTFRSRVQSNCFTELKQKGWENIELNQSSSEILYFFLIRKYLKFITKISQEE